MKKVQSYPNGYKTLREKEKSLVTSNFFFSPSVFKRLVSEGRQKVSLCGNGLNYSQDEHAKDICTILLEKVQLLAIINAQIFEKAAKWNCIESH